MLRLRRFVERTSRRRWLGPVVLVLLFFLLVLVALHNGLEHGLERTNAVVCLAIVVAALVIVVAREVFPAVRLAPAEARGPPSGASLSLIGPGPSHRYPLRR